MKRKQGQSMVEMALISPFLVMTLLMVIDCGRAAYDYATLAGAAREGARAAITTGSNRPDNNRVIGAIQLNAIGLQLSPGSCVNDTPPVTPSMSANTGLIYVGAGNGNTTPNAPAGQPSSAGGACGPVAPSYAGHYPLAVTIKYNFKPLTPFGSQFFPSGIVMTVTSTMSTEY
ncbi:MAG: pilus assembly protein [Chloroflexi bacterium]|nr:MAG: pilus assembly protein [Chloroflexota bacterium]